MAAEVNSNTNVDWHDSHGTYQNKRGLTIIQNHFTYALKLSRGDQTPLQKIPSLQRAATAVTHFIHRLGTTFPSLATWQPDELSLHRYDAEVGLSRHKDNARFIGVIAIAALDGECDLAITGANGENLYPTVPGDLLLLRAPGLTESTEDIRPEHAVVNLRTPTRTSLMLRANDKPDEAIPGFTFANWQTD